ncbi:hypothetical protein E2C01_100683 [Portunus trituberculatus]|uniref:Uncharacterized protein n=1 Tax=Portunus trituberculatus TaxID=210409 RepID=A0A5B7KI74_PORTR|nr:hypothetical protein [Portunus trituberculatus]
MFTASLRHPHLLHTPATTTTNASPHTCHYHHHRIPHTCHYHHQRIPHTCHYHHHRTPHTCHYHHHRIPTHLQLPPSPPPHLTPPHLSHGLGTAYLIPHTNMTSLLSQT